MPLTPASSLQPPADAALAERVDAVLSRALDAQRLVGAVVLIARDGRLVYHRAAGFADRESRTQMREDTLFTDHLDDRNGARGATQTVARR